MTDLSEEQYNALQQYLDSINEVTGKRGLRYFGEARVSLLKNDKSGAGISAEVKGTKRYRVTLHFVEATIE